MFSLRPTFLLLAFFTAIPVPAIGAEPKGKEAPTLAQAIDEVKKQKEVAATALHTEWPKLATLEAQAGLGLNTVAQRKKVADLLKAQIQKDIDHQRLLDLQAHARAADDGMMAETKSLDQWLTLAKKKDSAAVVSGSPLSAYDYSAVNKRVLEASKETAPAETGPNHSIPELAAYLTAGAKNDREKAWALSYWVAYNLTYDYEVLKGEPKDIVRLQQPEEVFKRRIAVCEGHGRLLEALGQACGLEIKYITGHSRSPGEVREAFRKYSETAPNGVNHTTHGWNAVKLGDHWYMIDSTFADANVKQDGQFAKGKLAPHAQHLLIPPEWTIYTHIPKSADDQFLKTPLSRKESEVLPLLSPPYFTNGLKLEAPFAPVIKAEDSTTIVIHVPVKCLLRAELDEVDIQQNKKVRVPQGHCLVQRTDDLVRLHVSAPKAGTFFLTLYAGAADPLESALVFRLEFTGKSDKESGFPVVTKDYYERKANVLSPTVDTLEAGKVSYFAIRAPGAKAVRVVAGDGKQYTLFPQDDLHMGCLILPPGEVKFGAIYPERPTAILGLAIYQAKKDK